MKPKVIHSFWTRPLEINMYGVDRMRHMVGDIWFFALSLAYLNRGGFEVELHTDTLGERLMGHLPYDNIHLTLDGVSKEISPRFWAAGKIHAIEAAGDGAVHVDGDVFIKDAKLLDVADDADVIVQSIEHGSSWVWDGVDTIAGFPEFCRERGLSAEWDSEDYNNGVVGVMNAAIRQEWVARYKEFATSASKRFGDALLRHSYITPDIIAEQTLLYNICKRDGAKHQLIIPDAEPWPIPKTFQHILTSRKYNVVGKVKATLERFFPEIHAKTLKLCQNI